MRDARRKVKKAPNFRVSLSLSLSFLVTSLCSRASDFPAFTILHGRTRELCVTGNLRGMKGEDFDPVSLSGS